MYKCNKCGGTLKDARGLAGHNRFKHHNEPLDFTKMPDIIQEKTQETPFKNIPTPDLSNDFNARFNKIVELEEKNAYLRYLKNFGKTEENPQNNILNTLVAELIKTTINKPETDIIKQFEVIEKIMAFKDRVGGAGEGEGDISKELITMLPLILNKQPAPVNAAPSAQPQVAQAAQSDDMNTDDLVNDLLDYIPENYKQQIKEGKITLEQARGLALSNMHILKPLFKKNYDTELTPDVLDLLLTEGFKKLKQ